MHVWIYTIISVTIVSLLSLIGIVTLAFNKVFLHNILKFLVSFAVGGLFGDAFIHLIPESFRKLGFGVATSLYILAGMLIFFVLEKFIRWRHCHVPTSSQHPHPVVALNFIGDGAHNFIDGLVIGASFLISIPLGVATSLAVIFHEIPHELGNFGIYVNGGLTVRRALFVNFLSALTSMLGGVTALLVGTRVQGFAVALLPITAGGFIYVAGSDLVPELHGTCDIKVSQAVWQFVTIVLGIALMASMLLLER